MQNGGPERVNEKAPVYYELHAQKSTILATKSHGKRLTLRQSLLDMRI